MQESFLGGKGGQCVGLTTLPPSCADLKFWDPQTRGVFETYLGQYKDSFTFAFDSKIFF
jgi:hypothetical protein